ncbi:MAG: hypothetical protein ABI972_01545 [Acidobacteriota bacterium]
MKLALFALVFTAALQAAVEGVVMNGTTGKPQAGATMTLFKIDQNGPNALDTIKAGPDGSFKFAQEVQGPHLLQAVHEGMVFNKMLPPGRPTTGITVDVYNATTNAADAKVTTHMILLEPTGSELAVNESIIFQNDSKTAYYDTSKGTLRVALPNAAGGKARVMVTGPASMPIERVLEKTKTAGVYTVDFPVKPGETRFDLTYAMPLTTPGKFDGKVLHDGPVRVVAPQGVTLTGDVKQLGTEPQTQAGIYELTGRTFSIGIEGTGSLRAGRPGGEGGGEQAEEDGGAGLQQIRPRIYVRFKEILALSLAALIVGFILLYRKGASKA